MKPSRSLRPNHSWLRNFFVVMGENLRAGRGAKQSAVRVGARRAKLPDENVYSRRRGGTPNPLFECCTLAGLPRGALPHRANPPLRIMPIFPGETTRSDDIARGIGWVGDVVFRGELLSSYSGIASNSLSRDPASCLPLSVM